MNTTHRLYRFLDAEGRLCIWPAKYRDRLLVLDYLAAKFAYQQEYSEKEVNALLQRWHTFGDWALLRRELYDQGFLGRKRDVSAYWRIAKQHDNAEADK